VNSTHVVRWLRDASHNVSGVIPGLGRRSDVLRRAANDIEAVFDVNTLMTVMPMPTSDGITVITLNVSELLRSAMDMRVLDRIERGGRDVEPISYAQGVINGVHAAIEAFTLKVVAATDHVQVVLIKGDNDTLTHITSEIARTNP